MLLAVFPEESLDAVTGLPISIEVIWTFVSTGVTGSVQTDGDGYFIIGNLISGLYKIELNLDSYGTKYFSGYNLYDGTHYLLEGQAITGINFKLEPRGSISGRVTDELTGDPIEGATVDAATKIGGSFQRITTTGSDGTYTINDVSQLYEYNVHAYKVEGYVVGSPVTVKPELQTTGIDFTLIPLGKISGKVIDTVTGLPVVGATISIEDLYNNSATTGPDGTYTITRLSPAGYKVKVHKNGYADEYFDNASLWNSTIINVSAGQTVADINFSLVAGGSISGRITNADTGQPVGSMSFELYNEQHYVEDVHTDSNSYYIIEHILPGNYQIKTYDNTSYYAIYYNDAYTWETATTLSIQNLQAITGIDIALQPKTNPTGSIYGQVINNITRQPIAGVTVWAKNLYGHEKSAQTDANGNYAIRNLPPDNYRVEVNQNGYSLEYYNNIYDWYDATLVTVLEGQNTKGIDIALDPASSISGIVTDASTGEPLAGVTVRARSGPDGGRSTQTDANGSYTINNLLPGEYRIESYQDGYIFEYYDNSSSWDSATPVTLQTAQTLTEINFALQAGENTSGVITGRVTKSNGDPIEHATISIYTSEGRFYVFSNPNGEYIFDNIPFDAPVYMNASADGYALEWWQEAIKDNERSSITLTAQTPCSTNINFTLDLGGAITGKVVTYSTQTPISGIFVEAFGSGYGSAWTDADGNYTIQNLPAGDYYLEIEYPGYAVAFFGGSTWENATKINITTGQKKLGPWELRPGGSVSGKITDTSGNPLDNVLITIIGYGPIVYPANDTPYQYIYHYYACTDSDGYYSYSSIPGGFDFTVKSGGSCVDDPEKIYPDLYWRNTANESSATKLSLSTNLHYTDLNFMYGPDTPTFIDVPVSHPLYAYIEALYAAGYTAGCSTNPLKFCPDAAMNRGMAAVFMLRGQFGSAYLPPNPTGLLKDDWSRDPWAQSWSESMYTAGLSAGCTASPLKYCPWSQLTRVEASVFGLRMKYGMNYEPDNPNGVFFDMADPNFWGKKWGLQAYRDGLLPACGIAYTGEKKFCPNDVITRAWAAYLIVTAKGLPLSQ